MAQSLFRQLLVNVGNDHGRLRHRDSLMLGVFNGMGGSAADADMHQQK